MSLLTQPTPPRLRRAQLISQARRSEAKAAGRVYDLRAYKDFAPREPAALTAASIPEPNRVFQSGTRRTRQQYFAARSSLLGSAFVRFFLRSLRFFAAIIPGRRSASGDPFGLATRRAVGLAKAEARQRSTGSFSSRRKMRRIAHSPFRRFALSSPRTP